MHVLHHIQRELGLDNVAHRGDVQAAGRTVRAHQQRPGQVGVLLEGLQLLQPLCNTVTVTQTQSLKGKEPRHVILVVRSGQGRSGHLRRAAGCGTPGSGPRPAASAGPPGRGPSARCCRTPSSAAPLRSEGASGQVREGKGSSGQVRVEPTSRSASVAVLTCPSPRRGFGGPTAEEARKESRSAVGSEAGTGTGAGAGSDPPCASEDGAGAGAGAGGKGRKALGQWLRRLSSSSCTRSSDSGDKSEHYTDTQADRQTPGHDMTCHVMSWEGKGRAWKGRVGHGRVG